MKTYRPLPGWKSFSHVIKEWNLSRLDELKFYHGKTGSCNHYLRKPNTIMVSLKYVKKPIDKIIQKCEYLPVDFLTYGNNSCLWNHTARSPLDCEILFTRYILRKLVYFSGDSALLKIAVQAFGAGDFLNVLEFLRVIFLYKKRAVEMQMFQGTFQQGSFNC